MEDFEEFSKLIPKALSRLRIKKVVREALMDTCVHVNDVSTIMLLINKVRLGFCNRILK